MTKGRVMLREEQLDGPLEPVDPDTLFGNDMATTFIYMPDGELFEAPGTVMHIELAKFGEFDTAYGAELNKVAHEIVAERGINFGPAKRYALERVGLCGRYGPDYDHKHDWLAFWGGTPRLKSLLQACTRKLLDTKKIDNDTLVTLDGGEPATVAQVLTGRQLTDNPEAEELKQIHFMADPQAKAALRRKYGKEPPPRRDDWKPEWERREEYWPTSESYLRVLDRIFTV